MNDAVPSEADFAHQQGRLFLDLIADRLAAVRAGVAYALYLEAEPRYRFHLNDSGPSLAVQVATAVRSKVSN